MLRKAGCLALSLSSLCVLWETARWGKASSRHGTPLHEIENSQEAGKILVVLLKKKKGDERKWAVHMGFEQESEENLIILGGTTPSLWSFKQCYR